MTIILSDPNPSNPTPELFQLPALDQLTWIYAQAMKLQLNSERLTNRGFQLKRLSLNTEVVAAQVAEEGQPFSVIARDVRLQAERISQEMLSLQAAGNVLAGHAVASLARARICEKYTAALTRMTPGPNRSLLTETLTTNAAYLRKAMQGMEKGLKEAHENARNLSRLSVHLPVVATMFRIESARTHQAAAELFRSMSRELVDFSSTFSKELEQVLQLCQDTINLCNNNQFRGGAG